MALTQTSLTPTPAGSPLTPFLLFRAGNWNTTPFQFPAPSAEVDDDTHLKKLGFDPWTATEGLTASADMLPLALRVWKRQEHPRFAVELDTLDSADYVPAHDLPAVMELLATLDTSCAGTRRHRPHQQRQPHW